MTSKLDLYNQALLILGERRLASLGEAREPRRALDDAWESSLRFCLEQGFWNFAMRAIEAQASASVVPTFGYAHAFTKPNDWIRSYQVSASETFDPPLLNFVDEPNYWYADSDPLYVRYVSDDTVYGRDMSIWPETFTDYVAHHLALRTSSRITGNAADDALRAATRRARADARSKDAMNEPTRFPPAGTWVTSRGTAATRSRWDGQGV